MNKFELHVHTSECDVFAQMKGCDIVKLYKDAGYSGLVVTDHYFSMFFDWFKKELDGASHKQLIDRWLRGFYSARNEGEKYNFTVLLGAEVRFDGSINDYLVYGLEPHFFYDAPLLNRLSGLEELLSILPQDACVVQAHPFRDNMTVCNPAPLFGIEGFNGGTEKFRNQMAKDFAKYYKKAITSGSDFHTPSALAKGGILTDRIISSEKDLVSVLRDGNYSIIENY